MHTLPGQPLGPHNDLRRTSTVCWLLRLVRSGARLQHTQAAAQALPSHPCPAGAALHFPSVPGAAGGGLSLMGVGLVRAQTYLAWEEELGPLSCPEPITWTTQLPPLWHSGQTPQVTCDPGHPPWPSPQPGWGSCCQLGLGPWWVPAWAISSLAGSFLLCWTHLPAWIWPGLSLEPCVLGFQQRGSLLGCKRPSLASWLWPQPLVTCSFPTPNPTGHLLRL